MNLPEYFSMILDELEARYTFEGQLYRPSSPEEGYIASEALLRLKEIVALRDVLKIHDTYVAAGSSFVPGCYCVGCGSVEYNSFPRTWNVNECPTLLALVGPYSDRADFGSWS